MLGGISKTVSDADDFVQGLKRHWLLRSAFKTKTTNAPPTNISAQERSWPSIRRRRLSIVSAKRS